jgi:hypothetical protein
MLIEAIRDYDYPPVTYDFVKNREYPFGNMRDLESYLQGLLHATDEQRVKDGLSGVLYWGFYRVGYRDDRVKKFREKVSDWQLRQALEAFSVLEGTGLNRLSKLGLPQFSNMAFVTKLRTFLEPKTYCVLDSKIASLRPLAARLKRRKTSIPITHDSEQTYGWWVDVCGSIAQQFQMQPELRPVDAERGLFHLVDCGKIGVAERLLTGVTASLLLLDCPL